ncbi:hypothetical protein [Variovorax sp. PAMC26660]|uniref:hypothetical protein n=1 Tax=Variovorax sp. PAMC26660 TaxID=2762322 RepID=UPI00164E0673|nr:hypothetical protein [Variovorax sp. PAMC26660]QNK65802.1 hypothetical protein H7F35_21630 [Variovorax sp. PAMC26660]
MAFRADEAAQDGYDEVEDYFVNRLQGLDEDQRTKSRHALRDIVDQIGPAINTYPTWHPLVWNHKNYRSPATTPSDRCGYQRLDHTRFFVNGFISCPYGDGADEIIASVAALPRHPAARLTAEKLDVKFYSTEAKPVLIKCEWEKHVSPGETIPLAIAMPLILQKEVPCSEWSEVAETWESMRHYLLGSPRGARSSLFLSQDAGQAVKKIWEALIYTGMFGPIKVDRTR